MRQISLLSALFTFKENYMQKTTSFLNRIINPPLGKWLSKLMVLIGVLAFSIGMTFQQHSSEDLEKLKATYSQKLESNFSLSKKDVQRVICSHGQLFYPNPGVFGGYLPYNPPKKCPQNSFDAIQRAKATKSGYQSLAFLGFVIYLFAVGWVVHLRNKSKEEGGV